MTIAGTPDSECQKIKGEYDRDGVLPPKLFSPKNSNFDRTFIK